MNNFEVATRSEALLLRKSEMAMRSNILLTNESDVATASFETETLGAKGDVLNRYMLSTL